MTQEERIEKFASTYSKQFKQVGYDEDQIDTIYEAMIAAANFTLQNQWIFVNNELPKLNDKGISEEVFVRTSFGGFRTDRYLGMCKEWEYGHRNITHWMPIPTLKGGEK